MEPFRKFFSPGLVMTMAGHLARHRDGIDPDRFAAPILAALEPLELKARAQLIADHLHAALPADAAARARILAALLHPDPLDHADRPSDDLGLCGWAVLPLTMVVGQHGLADFGGSMTLLREMTKRFSAEFGIRYFLLADQDRALSMMAGWLDDPNRHVRRLISEGSRPRLPWAMRLPGLMDDPTPVLPLLRHLRDDPEPYVRRSVANHLNDIAKDHSGLVIRLARDWMTDAGPDRQGLLRHACRTLIKQGDADALAVFGQHPARIGPVTPHLDSPKLQLGETLGISAHLCSTSDKAQDLTVDIVVHFRKASGALAPKVFKGARLILPPAGRHALTLRLPLRPVTTRRHYAGRQALALRINGTDTGLVEFELLV